MSAGRTSAPPVIWSVAGHDSSGGAGLCADQRAADALGVHLCPVVATLTAQHSQGVPGVFAVATDIVQAQLNALSEDLPPAAIKTGLLGSVGAIEAVARWVDQRRRLAPAQTDPHHHLALIVDPVLSASAGGSPFSDDAIVAAYRQHLLPRATVLTPNRAEALRLLGHSPPGDSGPARDRLPHLASQLRALGARSVVITGGDAAEAHSIDWIDTPQAQGWLTAPRVRTPHGHGTGCTFATGVAAALAHGHCAADAIVLAKMLTHHALSHAHAAGRGSGPVCARAGFAAGPAHGGAPLPWLGLHQDLPWRLGEPALAFVPFVAPADGLYGLVGCADSLQNALQAGLHCVQLRHKATDGLKAQIRSSMAAAAAWGATLFINDHWQAGLAAQWPQDCAPGTRLGVHLGQEDLLALTPAQRLDLQGASQRVLLGLSSHSLWELARAAGCGASLIACGPVQATTTKDMPWRPQGPDNLRWWVAHSPVPVVAIGGLLTPDDLHRFARCGAAALCVVRGLGASLAEMRAQLPGLRQAVASGRAQALPLAPAALPHPVL